jgi:hypothetical protein
VTGTDPAEPRWRRGVEVLWRRSLDAVVLLPPGHDEPVELAGSGPELWDLLVEPGTVAQLAAVLAAAHGVDEQTVIDDISPVIERLAGLGVVEPA